MQSRGFYSRNGSCVWIDLIKSDRKLREDLNNPDLFKNG